MNLITGGTGFLGAHLAAKLLKQQQEVTILKRNTSDIYELKMIFSYHFSEDSEKFFNKLKFIEGDICFADSLRNIFENISRVYHCAATVSFDRKDHKTMFEVNVNGTANIVNLLLEYPHIKLCHVSSIAALGRSNKEDMINEHTYWENHKQQTAYSVSKYQAELEVWRGIAEGLNAVIVMPGVILGPGDLSKGTCKLFSLVNSGLKFYTKGINGYVDVEDVSAIMIHLMNSDISNNRFLLVSENLTYKQILSCMAMHMEKPPPHLHAGYFLRKLLVIFDAFRASISRKPRNYSPEFARIAGSVSRYDTTKIKTITGYEFNSLNSCIAKTSAFYKKFNL